MEGADRVVVAAARRSGEGVVGVVYLLELLRARGALWRIGGDAVRVVFQRLLLVGIANLLLRRFRVDLEGGVWDGW